MWDYHHGKKKEWVKKQNSKQVGVPCLALGDHWIVLSNVRQKVFHESVLSTTETLYTLWNNDIEKVGAGSELRKKLRSYNIF